MKRNITILFLLFILSNAFASEYYGLLVGYNAKGERVMKGTCRSYPLNFFINILEQKEKLNKYFPAEKLDYLSFKILGQRDNDDFYYKKKNFEFKENYKNPETLRKYLSNLYFVIYSKRKDLLKDKIFENEEEIEEFICPLMTLIGILETMTENNCVEVTWVAKLY